MVIELTIDELILNGLQVQDQDRLRSVVSAELTRLISEQGLPPSLSGEGAVPVIQGRSITVKLGAPAEVLGGQIAQAVMGGLSGE